MSALLDDRSFNDPFLPSAWKSVLVNLQQFLHLEQKMREAPGSDVPADQQERLIRLHEELVSKSAGLLEPRVLDDLSGQEVNRILGRSIMLLIHMKQAVLGEGEVLDTAGSRTLHLYESDYFGSSENLEALKSRVRELLNLSAADFQAIEERISGDVEDAHRKQRIVQALRNEFHLESGEPRLREHVHRLFRILYPGSPLVPEEVDIILTATMIFFCIPYEGNSLTTSRFSELTPDERRPVEEFLKKIQSHEMIHVANFPVFGPFQGKDIDTKVLEKIAAGCQVSPDQVAFELNSLVTILPLAEVDKFVVHDVWGHGWQASMLQFEHMYREMARFEEPLNLGVTVGPPRTRKRFRDCFLGSGKNFHLSRSGFRSFVDQALADRIPVAFSGALAEIMADVVEFKILSLHPERAELLPSSSFFRSFPSKLDLTMKDLSLYFDLAKGLFQNWAESPAELAKTTEALVRSGADHGAAERAVNDAAREWIDLARELYSTRLSLEDAEGDRIRVNVFTRLALNLLAIHRAIIVSIRQLDGAVPSGLPLKSFKDLLVLSALVFFEEDREKNFWRLDEFLSLRFLPFCYRLATFPDDPANQ